LIWKPCDDEPVAHTEQLVHSVPSLHLADTGEEAAIANALAQTDGAAIFDVDSCLTAIGVRLASSSEAERRVSAMRGMRHISALRYSFDDRQSIVIVVSESGPITLMHAGKAITTVDPSAEAIG
jgi:DNA integrity scanning protein DisA with diadenylate cyclase activity